MAASAAAAAVAVTKAAAARAATKAAHAARIATRGKIRASGAATKDVAVKQRDGSNTRLNGNGAASAVSGNGRSGGDDAINAVTADDLQGLQSIDEQLLSGKVCKAESSQLGMSMCAVLEPVQSCGALCCLHAACQAYYLRSRSRYKVIAWNLMSPNHSLCYCNV